jgi:hypothetical protein
VAFDLRQRMALDLAASETVFFCYSTRFRSKKTDSPWVWVAAFSGSYSYSYYTYFYFMMHGM